jgi:hypothetical protein
VVHHLAAASTSSREAPGRPLQTEHFAGRFRGGDDAVGVPVQQRVGALDEAVEVILDVPRVLDGRE